MKNRFLFLFLLFLFSVGAAVAQTPEKHWHLDSHPGTWDALNMTAKMIVQVDGEELSDPNIEMAAFIGETLMSEGEFPILHAGTGHYVYYMTLNGYATAASNNNHNRLTFRLYDHSNDTELDYTCPLEIMYSTNWDLGTVSYPVVVSFFSGEYETEWRMTDGADLQSGDIVVIGATSAEYLLARKKGALGEVYDAEYSGDILTYTEPTSANNWYKSAPQIINIYRDSVANANNAYAFFANDGYLYSPDVDPDDELESNDIYTWPSLIQSNKQPVWTAYWNLLTDGDGGTTITALGENPFNTMQYNPDEEFFAWYEEALYEPVRIYRLTLIKDEPQTYTLTVNIDPEDGGTVTITPEQEEYEEDDQVGLTAIPEDGYTFIGWYVDGEMVSEDDV